ncbi:MAG TPA: hypothetical protein DEA08_09695 [Planctomycetes bacterium]|nr:hypothetical protein [Planctomycetota bacterium]
MFAAILRALARASGLSEKQRASFEEILPGLNPPGPLLLSLTKSVPEQLLVDTADGQPGEELDSAAVGAWQKLDLEGQAGLNRTLKLLLVEDDPEELAELTQELVGSIQSMFASDAKHQEPSAPPQVSLAEVFSALSLDEALQARAQEAAPSLAEEHAQVIGNYLEGEGGQEVLEALRNRAGERELIRSLKLLLIEEGDEAASALSEFLEGCGFAVEPNASRAAAQPPGVEEPPERLDRVSPGPGSKRSVGPQGSRAAGTGEVGRKRGTRSRRSQEQRGSGDKSPGKWIVLVGIVVVVGSVLALALRGGFGPPQDDQRLVCAERLRALTRACEQYAQDKRFYPHWRSRREVDGEEEAALALGHLLETGEVEDPSLFLCPGSTETPATGKQLGATNLSYYYQRKQLHFNCRTTEVLFVEPVHQHRTPQGTELGAHVAHVSGKVVWYPATATLALEAARKLTAGTSWRGLSAEEQRALESGTETSQRAATKTPTDDDASNQGSGPREGWTYMYETTGRYRRWHEGVMKFEGQGRVTKSRSYWRNYEDYAKRTYGYRVANANSSRVVYVRLGDKVNGRRSISAGKRWAELAADPTLEQAEVEAVGKVWNCRVVVTNQNGYTTREYRPVQNGRYIWPPYVLREVNYHSRFEENHKTTRLVSLDLRERKVGPVRMEQPGGKSE